MTQATSIPRRPIIGVRRQRYSWRQRLRASLYERAPLFIESLVSFALVLLVVLGDVLYLLMHNPKDFGHPLAALSETLGLLTFQLQPIKENDPLGLVLLIFNIFFSLFFAQSLLNSARSLFRRRTMEAQQLGLATTLHDHVIVCGIGRMGLRAVSGLIAAGVAGVVIERDPAAEMIPRVLELGVPVVMGDAREVSVLRRAGLKRARAVLACIDGDLTNVEIALAARTERPDIRVILRAFSDEFDRGLDRGFGRNSAFSASRLAAPTFAAAAVSRSIEHVLPLDGELLGVTHFTVPAESEIFASLDVLEQRGLRVVHHMFAPQHRYERKKSRQALVAGDILTVLGPLPILEKLRLDALIESSTSAMLPVTQLRPTEQHNTIIVCGLGKVGYRVVRLLHQMRPRPRIVVIHLNDDDDRTFSREISQLDGILTILGDATDPDVLARAGLQQAATVAAVTSEDLTNLKIGLEARRLQPDIHVVLRVFSDNLALKLPQLFGIHTTYSTSDLASSTLAAAAILGDVDEAFFADDQLYALDEITAVAGDLLTGTSIAAIREQHGATVVGIGRGGVTYPLPPAHAEIAVGDTVVVVAPLPALEKVRSFARAGGPRRERVTSR